MNTGTVRRWRIVLDGTRHRAVCGNCAWPCPVHGCCGTTALQAAHALHTACAGGPRLADRPGVTA